MANNENSFLQRFAVNLNERASQGKLDPVIGRDDEIRRVLQILSRRTKNNPILVGEPGVGKTAISEGISPSRCTPWTWAPSSRARNTRVNSKSA